MKELLELLNGVFPLSDALQNHLQDVVRFREIKKKDYLLKAGHISRNLYFIQTGLLKCFYIKDDVEVCSWFMKEGDIIVSIESFYDQRPSYESIQALEDCELFYIGFDELEAIYKNYMEFNVVGRLLTIEYFKRWARQLYAIRMQSAEERYHWLVLNEPELVLRVPAKFIASYLDITEVTLSKIKGSIQKKRAI
jgi:CRP-like cAMP-binding protein